MTNKKIRYELFECIATTSCVKGRLNDELDVIALETMKDRLTTMFTHFDELYKEEIKRIDKDLNNILK